MNGSSAAADSSWNSTTIEALGRKPGALPGSTVLEQARAAGKFTPMHDAWWAAVRKARGDAEGTPRADSGPAAAPQHGP